MEALKKILIIDDEIELSQLLRNYFLRKKYDVRLSHTLKEGLQSLEEYSPDIVFLDNNLPDGIGWEIAPQLAAEHPDIFLLLISAFHPVKPDMPQNAKYKVIEKPISFSDIDASISHII